VDAQTDSETDRGTLFYIDNYYQIHNTCWNRYS